MVIWPFELTLAAESDETQLPAVNVTRGAELLSRR
jgi:hypothetical protein